MPHCLASRADQGAHPVRCPARRRGRRGVQDAGREVPRRGLDQGAAPRGVGARAPRLASHGELRTAFPRRCCPPPSHPPAAATPRPAPQVWNEHACVKVAWDFVRLSRFRQYSALSAPAMTQVVRILESARPSAIAGRIGQDWCRFANVFVDIIHWCHLKRMGGADVKQAQEAQEKQEKQKHQKQKQKQKVRVGRVAGTRTRTRLAGGLCSPAAAAAAGGREQQRRRRQDEQEAEDVERAACCLLSGTQWGALRS